MAEGEGLKSGSTGFSQILLYLFAIVFVLLVLAGVVALLKYLWLAVAG